MKHFLLFCFSLFYSANAFTEVSHNKKDFAEGGKSIGSMQFIEEKDQGWFFYKDLPEKTKKELAKKIAERMIKSLTPPPPPPVGSTKWMEKNMPTIRAQAIDNPTNANVKKYLILERLMFEKAKRYAEKTRLIVLKNPYLDSANFRSTNIQGSRIQQKDARDKLNSVLHSHKDSVGIWFFFDQNHPMSDSIAKELQMLENQIDLAVMAVSIDGKPLKNGLYPDFKKNNGFDKKLNLTKFPALVLHNVKSNEFLVLSYGYLTAQTLKQRIISLMYDSKWITEQEYWSTKRGKRDPLHKLIDMDISNFSDSDIEDSERFIEALEVQMGVFKNGQQ